MNVIKVTLKNVVQSHSKSESKIAFEHF